ncbi:transposase [Streptomyces mirabilis]|uniref:transposase n=1 Tax=Streptomyces mirabilis TaxID=68239 RepID=UPI0033B8F011
MEKEEPRPRRSFTPEFKAKIVKLCQRGDHSVGQVGKDFDLTGTSAASAQGRPSLCEDEHLTSGQTFTVRVAVPGRTPAGQL